MIIMTVVIIIIIITILIIITIIITIITIMNDGFIALICSCVSPSCYIIGWLGVESQSSIYLVHELRPVVWELQIKYSCIVCMC